MGPDTITGMFADAGYFWGWTAIKRMPEPVAASLFRSIADRTYERDGRSVQQLRRNLAPGRAGRTTGARGRRPRGAAPLSPLLAGGLPAAGDDAGGRACASSCSSRARTGSRSAIKSGRGVVCALPHMGNWDLAGAWVNQVHAPLDDRGGAAQARGAVRPLRRLPPLARHGGAAAHRWGAAVPDPDRAAARGRAWSASSPTAT